MSNAPIPPSPHAQDLSRATKRSLLPREHGAWGQLLVPIATALLIGGPSIAALALVVGGVAAFVAHEPLLILAGLRGERLAQQERPRAWRYLTGAVAIAAALGGGGLVVAAREVWIWAVPPCVLGLVLIGFVLLRAEKTLAGELVAAFALSGAAVPIGVAAGQAVPDALLCWTVFGTAFVVATVSVRSAIVLVMTRGRVRLGHFAAAVSILATFGAGGLAVAREVPWVAPVGLLPVSSLSLWLALWPPKPRRLKAVGWALVAASVMTALVLWLGPR